MRVFVTGAAGFVGSRLVARLRARGDAVEATDRELDVTRPDAVGAALAGFRPDAVAHLAALSFVPDSWSAPEAAFRVNFLGGRSVLDAAAAAAPAARVLLVGSGAVYGSAAPGTPPFDESAPLRPASPYAWSKAAADRLGALRAARGLDVVRARPFNHTGPGRPDAFVESSFARQLAELEAGRGDGRVAVGNLDAVRDFLDVDDVVDAYLRLLDPTTPAGVYNVASGRGRPIRAVLDGLLALTSQRPAIREDPARWRPADAGVGDASRLREVTGWQPRIAFEDTLSRLLDHWRKQVAAG